MSALNGDKARFHRLRKQKIARRKRNVELKSASVERKSQGSAVANVKPVSA